MEQFPVLEQALRALVPLFIDVQLEHFIPTQAKKSFGLHFNKEMMQSLRSQTHDDLLDKMIIPQENNSTQTQKAHS